MTNQPRWITITTHGCITLRVRDAVALRVDENGEIRATADRQTWRRTGIVLRSGYDVAIAQEPTCDAHCGWG